MLAAWRPAQVALRYAAVHAELASVQQSLATFAELEQELEGGEARA